MNGNIKKSSEKPLNIADFLSKKQSAESTAASDKYREDDEEENELFHADPDQKKKAWWKTNFLLTEGVKFGTWDGVFTTSLLNIFGIVIFLRTGWMVGNAGIGLSFLIIFLTMIIAVVTASSAIGICERCQMESGGVYYLLSHVLGTRLSSSIAFLYCFGQAVASSLYLTGLGESICNLAGWTNQWIAKGIGSGVLMLLMGINLAGVKWVVRLQLILLIILLISVLDFLLGSFLKQNPSAGVYGYSTFMFNQNAAPEFIHGFGFFAVFGVFFPTATGVCSGINMSGDLRDAKRSIPIGTLSAIGVSSFLYMMFVVALGGTCIRHVLLENNMITAKVALLGPLLLFGLYISSLSAALGGITTAPKILTVIADTTQLPGTQILTKKYGSNQVPVIAILCIISITLMFILIGNINVLGPIVTMPFLLTYASLTYSYFALAMSFDIRQRRESLFKSINKSARGGLDNKDARVVKKNHLDKDISVQGERIALLNSVDGDTLDTNGLKHIENYMMNSDLADGSNKDTNPVNELDKLFPERSGYGSIPNNSEQPTNQSSSNEDKNSTKTEIIKQPRSFYSVLVNRWISLFGTLMFILLMFLVNWIYTFAIIGVWFLLYVYIGYVKPGLSLGVSEFSMLSWIQRGLSSISICVCWKPQESNYMVPPKTPQVTTQPSPVSEHSSDFKERGKYHQTQLIHNDNVTRAIAGEKN